MIRPEDLRLPHASPSLTLPIRICLSLVNPALASEFHEPSFQMRITASYRNSQLCCPQSRCICDHRD